MPIYYSDNVLLCIDNPKGFEDYIKQAELKKLEEDTTNSNDD
jgi:hypothetical protein